MQIQENKKPEFYKQSLESLKRIADMVGYSPDQVNLNSNLKKVKGDKTKENNIIA